MGNPRIDWDNSCAGLLSIWYVHLSAAGELEIDVSQIEDYPPGNTIVIVPEKMQRFYEDTRVEPDPYPWQGMLTITR